MPAEKHSHVFVTLLRESSKMLVDPVPFDVERNGFVLLLISRVDVARVPNGLFYAEALLEFRYDVERTHLALCAARPIQC